jgi:hypothetical protein
MGSNSSSGGSGNKNSANNVPPSQRKYDVSGTLSDPREKDDTAAKMSLFREQGATDLKNTKFYTPTTAILAGVGQSTSRYNRDYFANEVLGKGAYKETTKQDFEKMSRTSQESLYSGYMSGRQSGKTDAYGNPVPQGDNGGAIGTSGTVVQSPIVTSPTTAEVSQSAATDATEDNILLRKRRTKARGRSLTIATTPTGATGSLTLGRPSLLGR